MTALPTTTAPSGNDYGGDEISALVLDPGFSTTRAGFAGEDIPKSVQPTSYGRTESKRYIFGDNSIHTPLPGLEIRNPLAEDGTIQDWEAAQKLFEYSITSRLTTPKPRNPMSNGLNDVKAEDGTDGNAMDVDEGPAEEEESLLSDNPLLMTEPSWNTASNREKSIEIAMEQWGCPAFWIARTGVLTAFASGKPTALVIDVGASSTSVTPVHDGLILRKGASRSPLAGNFVSNQLRLLYNASQPPIQLNPHYLVTSKTAVEAGQPAVATYRSFADGLAPHSSFRRLQEERVLQEFKESVVQTWAGPGRLQGSNSQGQSNEELAKSQPGRPFEFPDGYNAVFGSERFRAVEGLFDVKAALTSPDSPAPQQNQSITHLVSHALSQVDVDIRPQLMSNIVVTGATSLLHGFVERLNNELTQLFPGPRVRITAPGNTYERRYGSWIGGSILASLGTFHQMWISKREYEEQGAGIVEKRCK